MTIAHKPALILIDMQKAFDLLDYWGGHRNNANAEAHAALLLSHWRQHNLPVFHVQHCSTNALSPLAEGNEGHQFKDMVMPHDGETIVKKSVNSCFIGTNLKQLLDMQHITTVVIAGLTTDHCVSTSARMAGNFGFRTFVVADATATFNRTGADGTAFTAQTMHDTALASLHNEFATVLTASNLLQTFGL